ncbi:MAG TPA: hypothetical protein VMS16_06680 [Mycobacterium sp.]|nr:hypothetical protein [Mycobacterium sp.]
MANGGLGKVALSLTALTFLVGCSAPPQYSAPQSFTVSDSAVVQLVQNAVAGDREAAPIEGSPIVKCTGRTTCTISYTVREVSSTIFHKEVAADMQLFMPTTQMWKGLFSDPQFQSGTFTVKGPVSTAQSNDETATYFTMTCNRADAAKINWDSVDGHELRGQCDYKPETQGLPEYGESPRAGH